MISTRSASCAYSYCFSTDVERAAYEGSVAGIEARRTGGAPLAHFTSWPPQLNGPLRLGSFQ
jgi:hypothetical protein